MRKILCLAFLTLAACRPATPLRSPGEVQPPASPIATNTPPPISVGGPKTDQDVAPNYSSIPAVRPLLVRKTIAGIEFEGVSFDSRTHRLQVIDQPKGPGTVFPTSENLAQRKGALLAINAGFFTPEGNPLGLVISKGHTSGAWNSSSSLGSGIYMENSGCIPSIVRRSSSNSVSSSRELIQAGPLLIENFRPVGGLDPGKSALRSIILTDGNSRWWIGKTSSCTLASLAQALSNSSPAPWKVRQALNLDGGRSTDLFISGKVSGGPVNRRSFLNRPVRNFLILTAK